jgi:hypothetical protein
MRARSGFLHGNGQRPDAQRGAETPQQRQARLKTIVQETSKNAANGNSGPPDVTVAAPFVT